MMTDRTLGQVFHEAFVSRLNDREGFLGGTRIVFGTWDDCEPSYQEDTEAAAQAVVASYLVQEPSDLNHYIALMKENEAVIKAAEAKSHLECCIKKPDWSGCIRKAVEALLAAEGEECSACEGNGAYLMVDTNGRASGGVDCMYCGGTGRKLKDAEGEE